MPVIYIGAIVKESLEDTEVLEKVKVLETKVEKVTAKHNTPELKQWTVYKVEVAPEKAAKVANELSESLVEARNWYADFKNSNLHFIIFHNKVFRINRDNKKQYEEVKKYALAQGIPESQINFDK